MSTTPYRMIQWGPGRLGTFLLRTMLLRPDEFTVVGVLTYSDDKDGRDIGELAGLAPVGITATKDKEAIFALDADCVMFTPLIQLQQGETLTRDALRLLASGKNLLLAHDYFFPAAISEQYDADVEAACRTGKSSVLAVGTSPGFVSERLATTLSGHCLEVEHIDVLERMDCTQLEPHVYPHLGFGLEPAKFPRYNIVAMFDHMYRQTPYVVAEILGQHLQRVETEAEFAVTDRDLTDTTGPVPRGTVAGMAFSVTGYVDDRPFVTFTSRWVCDLLIPGWEVDNDWVITIEGTPSLQMNYKRGSTFADGVRRAGSRTDPDGDRYLDYQSWTTVAALINAVPEVCAAEPGHDIPPVFGACQHRRGNSPLSLRS